MPHAQKNKWDTLIVYVYIFVNINKILQYISYNSKEEKKVTLGQPNLHDVPLYLPVLTSNPVPFIPPISYSSSQ